MTIGWRMHCFHRNDQWLMTWNRNHWTSEINTVNFHKYSDSRKICCNHSTFWTMWLYHRVMSPNDADGMANSVDPDQTAPIWVCTVCSRISVRKLRIITVITRISKQVAQRATIAHLSPMCQGQSAPNLMQPFPHPNDDTHKIWSRLANWLQRYSSSKVWNFRHSRASNSKMSGLIRPKRELNRAFMPVLIPATFLMIWSKMNKLAWRHHFPIISLWEIF